MMEGAVIHSPRHLDIVDLPIPEIRDEEVLIKLSVCGMCMSEYPLWLEGTDTGRQLGHEGVGVIVQIGSKVPGYRMGDRVSGIFGKSFAEYTATHYSNIVPVPEGLGDAEAISEPLACLVSGAERTPIGLGADIALVGTGFMGLSIMLMMLIRGAGKVVAVDTRRDGLDNALRLGAGEAYLPEEVPAEYRITEWRGDLFEQGLDAVIEASGTQPGLALAGDMTKPHGTLSVVGYHQSADGYRDINMMLWNWKAVTVVNAHERRHHYLMDCCRKALRLIHEKRLNVAPLYTHCYPLEKIDRAYRDMKEKPVGYIKGYIQF